MLFYEPDSINRIAGVDEAGRGPWAGPVVAACVSADREQRDFLNALKGIKDSKQLSAAKRDVLFTAICQNLDVYFSVISPGEIDQTDILSAALLGMRKAVNQCRPAPELVLVDGRQLIKGIVHNQEAIVKGDQLVRIISAASIAAKVIRDRIMTAFHPLFPEYGFDRHKGYGTKQHLESLRKHGPCPIHRFSYKPVKNLSI